MPEIDDNTRVAIPLRNLVALGAGIVMATTAYVTLDTRIISIEHGQEIQNMNILENSAFVREWPLGLRGAYQMILYRTLRLWLWKNAT